MDTRTITLEKAATSSAMHRGIRGITAEDLIREIRRDSSLNPTEREEAINKVRQATSGNTSMPLSAFAAGGAGAIIANLAAKYFGMSGFGRALVTGVGFGIGSQVNRRIGGSGQRDNRQAGWS